MKRQERFKATVHCLICWTQIKIVERKSEIIELQCVIKGNQNSKHKCVIVGQL